MILRPFPRRLVLGILLWVAGAAALSAGLLKWQWDYVLSRPALDPRTKTFEEVLSVTPVRVPREGKGFSELTVDQEELKHGLSQRLQPTHDHPYYCLSERLLVDLQQHGMAMPQYTVTEIPPGLYRLLEESGVLLEGSPEYSHAKELRGLLVSARGAGRDYLFLGASGREIRNDDYPYYEFLFERKADGALHLLSWRRFIYGVAGMEGAEGFRVFLILTIFFLIPMSPVLMMANFLEHRIRKLRLASPPASSSG